ncbi:MBL fold metallo-hydrolase [Marinobacter nauticus]|nr:MBL fold metallo-hydrolase [Marinobacter nauticus]
MFIQSFKSDGLSHLSYLIGNRGEAVVIDPRRDCEAYAEAAAAKGCRLTTILETHRNEDLISGAPVLADLTGARVYHGPNAAGEVCYAETVREGHEFRFGNLILKVLETPGHTDDSLSFALYDTDFSEQ